MQKTATEKLLIQKFYKALKWLFKFDQNVTLINKCYQFKVYLPVRCKNAKIVMNQISFGIHYRCIQHWNKSIQFQIRSNGTIRFNIKFRNFLAKLGIFSNFQLLYFQVVNFSIEISLSVINITWSKLSSSLVYRNI